MVIKPYGKNILIQPQAKESVLLNDQGTLCEYGKVVAVGKEVTTVKEGDVLGFAIWGVNKLEVDGNTYYFLPESSDFILGFIEE